MESGVQRHERLLGLIEASTQAQGIASPDRRHLESLINTLSPRRINAILAGEVSMYWDPELRGLR